MRKSLPAILMAITALLWSGPVLQAAAPKKKPIKSIPAAKVDLGRPVDFQKDIAPILEANCVACHNVAIDESKLSLEDVPSILKGGKRGPAVVPKQPEKSLLFLVASRQKTPAMPPLPNKVDARALTPKEVGLIRQWILEGATQGMAGQGSEIAWAPLPPTLNAIYATDVSRWGRYAAAGRANRIVIYDLVTGKEIARPVDPALTPLQYEGRPMYPGGAAHRDFVHALAFSPQGNLLASGGFRTVKLWQKQPSQPKINSTQAAAVQDAAVSADGKWAAVALANNGIQIVSLADGKPVKTLTGHSGAVTGVDFSSDGSRLVSGSADRTVRVWDVAAGREIRRVNTPSAVNDVLFTKDASQILVAQSDNAIRLWPLAAPKTKPAANKKKGKGAKASPQPAAEKPLREFKGHGKTVTALVLVPPQKTQFVSASADGTVRLWDIASGRNLRSYNHGAPVNGVAVSPDGQLVVCAAANGTGRIWRTSNGQVLGELKGDLAAIEKLAGLLEEQAVAGQIVNLRKNEVQVAEKNQKDRQTALKKAQDAKTAADKALATAEQKVKPLNAALAKARAALAKNPKDKNLQKQVAQAEKAAQKPNDDLKKAKTAQAAAARSLMLAQQSVARAKQLLDTARKAQADAEQRQKQIDATVAAAKKAQPPAAKPWQCIVFSPDGKSIITAGDDGVLRFWNAAKGQPLGSQPRHAGPVTSLALTAEGLVLSTSADKTVRLQSTHPTWKLVARLGIPADKPLDLSASPFAGRVLSLAFSRDGKRLATGGGDPSRSGELMIWDVPKRQKIREIPDAHSDTVLGLQFNWDGTQILSGAADKFAKIFDVATGKHLRSFEGHTHHVLDVAWQADGSTVVTAGADNVIKIWNAATGEQRRTVAGYSKQITSVQFIGVGPNFVACSGDSRVQFHRSSNGQVYRRFSGPGDFVYSAAVGRDAPSVVANVNSEATVVVAGGEDGVLRVWNGAGQSLWNFEPPKPTTAGKTTASLDAGPAK